MPLRSTRYDNQRNNERISKTFTARVSMYDQVRFTSFKIKTIPK